MKINDFDHFCILKFIKEKDLVKLKEYQDIMPFEPCYLESDIYGDKKELIKFPFELLK